MFVIIYLTTLILLIGTLVLQNIIMGDQEKYIQVMHELCDEATDLNDRIMEDYRETLGEVKRLNNELDQHVKRSKEASELVKAEYTKLHSACLAADKRNTENMIKSIDEELNGLNGRVTSLDEHDRIKDLKGAKLILTERLNSYEQ